jgi:hypothetical protein
MDLVIFHRMGGVEEDEVSEWGFGSISGLTFESTCIEVVTMIPPPGGCK